MKLYVHNQNFKLHLFWLNDYIEYYFLAIVGILQRKY